MAIQPRRDTRGAAGDIAQRRINARSWLLSRTSSGAVMCEEGHFHPPLWRGRPATPT
jgi:hypothetical protein